MSVENPPAHRQAAYDLAEEMLGRHEVRYVSVGVDVAGAERVRLHLHGDPDEGTALTLLLVSSGANITTGSAGETGWADATITREGHAIPVTVYYRAVTE